jgi:lysophospholipase L1-like esterase
MSPHTFTYDNRTGRNPGRSVRVLTSLIPAVARVHHQAKPYATAWHAHNQRALTEPGRRWIVLGDSLSQGVGADAYDTGWVNQLHDRLDPADKPTIINLSATGARVSDVIHQQIPVYRSLRDPSHVHDLVTVLVGSNDLFGRRQFRHRLPDAFAELLESLPAGAVVATLPQPSASATHANLHIAHAAVAGAIHVVDLRTTGPRSWRGKLASDRFHPNNHGYKAIADAFEPVFRMALAGRGRESS